MMKLIRIFIPTCKPQDNDQQNTVFDLVNYPVITDSNTIQPFFVNELFISERPRIDREMVYRICDLLFGLFVEATEKLKSRPLDLDVVLHRPSSDLASSHLIDSSFLARRAARMSETSS